MSNVNVDTYVLRLSNTSNGDDDINPLLSVASDKNEWTTQIPARIVNKGKCFIKVISGNMTLEDSSNAAKRIVGAEAVAVFWRSNIPYLGFDIEDRGSGSAILGSALIPVGTQGGIVTIDSISSRTFTCPRLPERISIKKFYSETVSSIDNGKLIAANKYTAFIIPAEIVLEITFDEDMSVMTNREMNSIRN
tara:strand:- start:725 stop:1300 length:576 start_codon:yes stop_codon:yes gene_type:complete